MMSQAEKNYQVFKKQLPELLKDEANRGRFSVWHDEKLIGIYDTDRDAIQVGKEKFGDFPNFSIQEITDRVADLGYLSLWQ